MSLRETQDASIVISFFKYFYRWYGKIERKIINIYRNSQMYRLAKGFCAGVKICFRNSFWGRITEIKQANLEVLDGSRALQYLIIFYKRWKCKIIYYLRSSLTLSLAEDTKEELTFSPVRIVSVIIATSILVNVVLSIVLHKQIGLWGWLMRVLFLFAGISGLFCQADWLAIKQSSAFLRKMQR